MDLAELTTKCLYIFYIIGYSAYNPRQSKQVDEQGSYCSFRKSFSFIIMGMIIHIITFYGLAFKNATESSTEQSHFLFGNFLFIILWVTNISVIVQNLLFQSNLPNVHRNIEIIEEVFISKLEMRPDYSKFSKTFAIKIAASYFFFGIATAVMITEHINHSKNFTVSLCISGLMCLSITANLHALFYIEMQNFLGQYFIDNIKLAGNTNALLMPFGKIKAMCVPISHLIYFKHVHFKLWTISAIISEHFGWNLTFSCLENFVDAAYSTYWIYRFLVTGQVNISMIGKLNDNEL